MKTILNRPYLSSFLFALLFTLLCQFAVYFPWVGPEQGIIVSATNYKNRIAPGSKKDKTPAARKLAEDFLLIDISNDISLYCDSTSNNVKSVLCRDQATLYPCEQNVDFKKLSLLFKWLAEHQDRYGLIICDIIFDEVDTTAQTDELLKYIGTIQSGSDGNKIVCSSIYDERNKGFSGKSFSKFIAASNKAAVNEEKTEDLFFKYRLSYDKGNIKTLPLLMMERINKSVVVSNYGFFYRYRNADSTKHFAFNSFIPEMLISNDDIDSLRTLNRLPASGLIDTSISRIDLWQSLIRCNETDNFYLDELLRTSGGHKKNIMIGSFNHHHSDVHKTLYGEMDGATILLNIYYNLLAEENRLDMLYLSFMFICFFVIFLLLFKHPHNPYKGKNIFLKLIIGFFVEDLLYLVLVIMTLGANIFFNQVTNVIILAGFFLLSKKVIKHYKEKLEIGAK